jgi:hypothetical protein
MLVLLLSALVAAATPATGEPVGVAQANLEPWAVKSFEFSNRALCIDEFDVPYSVS